MIRQFKNSCWTLFAICFAAIRRPRSLNTFLVKWVKQTSSKSCTLGYAQKLFQEQLEKKTGPFSRLLVLSQRSCISSFTLRQVFPNLGHKSHQTQRCCV